MIFTFTVFWGETFGNNNIFSEVNVFFPSLIIQAFLNHLLPDPFTMPISFVEVVSVNLKIDIYPCNNAG